MLDRGTTALRSSDSQEVCLPVCLYECQSVHLSVRLTEMQGPAGLPLAHATCSCTVLLYCLIDWHLVAGPQIRVRPIVSIRQAARHALI